MILEDPSTEAYNNMLKAYLEQRRQRHERLRRDENWLSKESGPQYDYHEFLTFFTDTAPLQSNFNAPAFDPISRVVPADEPEAGGHVS